MLFSKQASLTVRVWLYKVLPTFYPDSGSVFSHNPGYSTSTGHQLLHRALGSILTKADGKIKAILFIADSELQVFIVVTQCFQEH